MSTQGVRDVQLKIMDIMRFIDAVCRENDIAYYIMGGTALGAVRHGGFIPWDDDLDIFMTPDNYAKFKEAFFRQNSDKFVLQEWKITERYLEYAKVRMNGTTFIEEVFKDREDLHHGIYVDIMILHKCPLSTCIQRAEYFASKYVTLVALSDRNWKPKTWNHKIALALVKLLPNRALAEACYKFIYKYDNLETDYKYCYFITKANFSQGVFDSRIFGRPGDINFEKVELMGPADVDRYLNIRYGDYMKVPKQAEQQSSVHAMVYDTTAHYTRYFSADEV